ncbi:MAG: GNAT family N-acetyltransferase [Bacteroidota bacterium]
MIFKTERCLVRKMEPSDFEGLFELHSDPDVMRYTSGDIQDEQACREDLQYLMEQYKLESTNLLVYGIENKQREFLGTCAILRNEAQETEIGYRLVQRFWKQGYATEITNGLLSYCQRIFDSEKLYAYCFVANTGSIRVLEKCGFSLEKEFMNEEDGLLDRKYSIKLNTLNVL